MSGRQDFKKRTVTVQNTGQNTGVPGVRHVVAVASGKGGVGKSTTAMNLAVALSVYRPADGMTQGLRVGMLDADIYGPSQPRMLGVKDAQPDSDGQRIEPVLAHGVRVMSMGFMVDEATPTVWRGPMVQSALVQMLRQVNWNGRALDGRPEGSESELDVLVVDMPPGTGDTQLSMTQQVRLSGAVIVSTPQDIALIDARKGLEMFNKVNVPILGIVENMSSFCCPNCGTETALFGAHGAERMAAELGHEVLAQVPLALEIRENTDAGRPLVTHAPDSVAAAAYRAMAARVWEQLLAQDAAQAAGTVQGPVRIVIEE